MVLEYVRVPASCASSLVVCLAPPSDAGRVTLVDSLPLKDNGALKPLGKTDKL